ncbi:MAG: N-6 DNA methylase [Synergistaceae bacterium]|nr:N-6 DNA methylase [Synergistaceae bacterium]
MITLENFRELLEKLNFVPDLCESIFTYEFKTCRLSADFTSKKLIYPEQIKGREHNNSFSANENFVVFECVYNLLKKGWLPEDIELEKSWPLGRTQKSGRADICVYNKNNSDEVLMIIECKTWGREFDKALNDMKTDGGQLFSYWQQESSAKWLVLYASDIRDGQIIYKSPAINCTDDKNLLLINDDNTKLYKNSHTAQEKFNTWRDTYNLEIHDDIIFSDSSTAYNIGVPPLRKRDLTPISEGDRIINKFEEILRHNNVSDKENSFNRLIALFICKLVDEINKENDSEVEFQYKFRADDYEILQDRLQRLYTEGMLKFMREEITYIPSDYPDRVFKQYTGHNRKNAIEDLKAAFRKLKFYSNNDFAFVDVHNEDLFYKNGKILVEVVQLFQKYRIVHDKKNQLLGDLFEQLLDKGFKQNEGQFFTPMPLTRFIWDCLPLKKFDTWPRVIDYACGAGHFLIDAIEAINHFIPSDNNDWVRDSIFGIEKDYRLARVSKVSLFMNGAGGGNIIFGDGLDNNEQIKPDSFDILTANPPYSVASFKQHLQLKQNKFSLLDSISNNGSEIEVLFIERITQLLKSGGIAAVILPSSILSNDSASYIAAREEILKNFMIRAIVKLGSKTFGATGTNTVIMFLEKFIEPPARFKLVYDSVDSIFESRNLEDWEDNFILSGYLDLQSLTLSDWELFINESLNFDSLPEYFKEYFDSFKAKQEFNARNFYDWTKKIEREKIFYYGLTYNNRTLIITAPNDNAGQKEFLGYDWSNRKGGEGIKIFERGGKLYNESDREAAGTLAHLVRQSFNDDQEIIMTQDNARFSRVVKTCEMLEFSRVSFNKGMTLSPLQKIVDMEGKTTLKKVFDVITERIDTNLLTPSQYITTETMLQNCQGITEFNGILPKGSVFRFKKGDILLSNIRPYLQKIWLADFDGGCSTNVHVFRIKDEKIYNNKYIFYMLARKNFFDFVMLNVKGLNMPQGKREHILDYVIPLPPINIQAEIVKECEEIDSQESNSRKIIEDSRAKIESLFRELALKTVRISLNNVVESITNRIDTSLLLPSQYVTTDTMLQKCEGIRLYESKLPAGSVIEFHKGDILLSNIRPYLKKLWIADFDGGCSPDVLVFRRKGIYSEEFIYQAMRREEFFDFVMQDVSGLKMPRGKREHILDFMIPAPSEATQQKFIDDVRELESAIKESRLKIKSLSGQKELILKKYLA